MMLDKLENDYDTIGIIGYGSIAQRHLSTLAAILPSCHFVIRTRQNSAVIPRQIKNRITITKEIDDFLRHKPKLTIIATPASEHAIGITNIIQNSKLVLIEKPIALNAKEASDIAAAAKIQGVFCMEAMWTRFVPVIATLKDAIDQGAIGDIFGFEASFGHKTSYDQVPRLYSNLSDLCSFTNWPVNNC